MIHILFCSYNLILQQLGRHIKKTKQNKQWHFSTSSYYHMMHIIPLPCGRTVTDIKHSDLYLITAYVGNWIEKMKLFILSSGCSHWNIKSHFNGFNRPKSVFKNSNRNSKSQLAASRRGCRSRWSYQPLSNLKSTVCLGFFFFFFVKFMQNFNTELLKKNSKVQSLFTVCFCNVSFPLEKQPETQLITVS